MEDRKLLGRKGLHEVSVYEARVVHIQAEMQNQDLDFLLLSSPESIFYVSGFRGYATLRPLFVVIPAEGIPSMLTPKIEWEFATENTWISNIQYYLEWSEEDHFKDPVKLLAHQIKNFGESLKIGIEGHHLPKSLGDNIRKELSHAEIYEGGSILSKLRRIKDPEEIGFMRKAGQVALAELEAEISALKMGATEYEIALAALNAGVRKAAELLGSESPFSPMIEGNQMVGFGTRSSVVHARATTRSIRKNELIMMCFCEYGQFCGYRLGMTRMVTTGKISDRLEDIIKTAMLAQSEVLRAIRPGVKACDMDTLARKVIADAGYGQYVAHRTGRGVGIGYVEEPQLIEGDESVLKPGMTITVEPGIYVPGVGGARLEDTILITEDGYECLTPYPKNVQHINL